MNKLFTKIAGAFMGIAMAIGVGAGISFWNSSAREVGAAATTVASYSRSDTTNSVTGGSFTSAAESKSGYYQDGSTSGNRYVQILSTTAYWTTTPTTITVSSKIGGGTGNKDLSNAVQAVLLGSSGTILSTTNITTKITTNTGDNYSTTITPVNNVYGIRIQHTKETGYNVRYYSFSLSYETSTTKTITYDSNGGSGEEMDKTTISGGKATISDCSYTKVGEYFSGWNSKADGSGDAYSAGTEYSFTESITLYAQWSSATLIGISIKTAPTTVSYAVDEKFDPTGLVINLNYSNGAESGTATYGTDSGFSFTPDTDTKLSVSNTTVTISFGGFTTTQNITVQRLKAITLDPSKTSTFPHQGITLTISNGSFNSTDYRVFKGAHINLSSSVGKMYKIELTYTSTSYDGGGWASLYEPKATTWQSPNTTSGDSGEQARITMILVYVPNPNTPATINGDSSVESGSQWTTGGITDDDAGTTVTGATYSFTASEGVTITSSSASNGTFTATGSGTVTVSATLDEYDITSLVVTITPNTPYINLTLESSDSPYTGQSISISAESGHLTGDGLTWSVIAGTISNQSSSNTGFTGKLASSGTVTVQAKDNGGSTTETISVTVTQTAFTTELPDTETVKENKTLQLSAVLNSGDQIDWVSGDDDVATVSSTGLVTGVAAGETTITAKSHNEPTITTVCTLTVTENPPVVANGKNYIIYGTYENNDTTTNYYLSGVSSNLGTATTTKANAKVYTAIETSTAGQFALYDGANYLSYTLTTNALTTSANYSANTALWTFEHDIDKDVDVVTNVGNSDRILLFNYNNGNPRFACYGSNTSVPFTIHFELISDPTSIVLDDHNITLENGQSKELTYTIDQSAILTWTSSYESVATVDEAGNVECVASAGQTIIRVFFDSNGNGLWDSGEPTDTCTITAAPPSIDFGAANYGGIATLIESTDNLDGKNVVFGRNNVPVVSGSLSGTYLTAVNNDSNIGGVSYDSTNKKMIIGNGRIETGVTVFTVNAVTGGYTFSTVIENEVKYLSESSAKSIFLGTGQQVWTISISNGTATITRVGGNKLQYNSGSPRFTTYNSNQSSIELYEFYSYYEEATDYAGSFLDGECSDTINDWDDLGDTFGELSDGAQNVYKIATHDAPSSYDADTITVEHAVARYDDALLKHPELRDNEFMGRTTEGTLSYKNTGVSLIFGISNTKNLVPVIIVISMISVTAVGGYFFLRKRKED